MNKFCLIAIYGRTYYVLGEVSSEQYVAIEKILKQIEIGTGSDKYKDCFNDFVKAVKENLGIKLEPLTVDYIFRK